LSVKRWTRAREYFQSRTPNQTAFLAPLERVMHFEPDTEWFPDAGGITEISRWCQPPDMHGKYGEPRQGDGMASRDFRRPLPGPAVLFA
jgi:hypothetical protein